MLQLRKKAVDGHRQRDIEKLQLRHTAFIRRDALEEFRLA
jgi:hypothetical protein